MSRSCAYSSHTCHATCHAAPLLSFILIPIIPFHYTAPGCKGCMMCLGAMFAFMCDLRIRHLQHINLVL